MASEIAADAAHKLIKGAHLVTQYFGRWPSFHDAEVLRVELSRATTPPRLVLDLYAFLITPEVDERGHHKLSHRSLVTFLLDDIQEVELEGFDLPCFGLSGRIACQSIEVLRVEPLAK